MGNLIPIKTARELRHLRGGAHSLERAAGVGRLTRLRAGAYVETDNLAGISDRALHLARISAARLAMRMEPVFSHESAAALHDIPLLGDWPERVHLTVPPGGTKTTAAADRSHRRLERDEIVELRDGTRLTSLTRTAIDLAASRSLLGGIVAISEVRRRGVGIEELHGALSGLDGARGVRRVRAAIARSSERSESPLESLVLARCQDYCFEPPEQQRIVRGIDGRDYRVDFAWRDGEILLEADGRSKYDTRLDDRELTSAEIVWEEKRREDAIRPMCSRFVRLGWSEAWGGHELLRRLALVGVPRSPRCAVVLTF